MNRRARHDDQNPLIAIHNVNTLTNDEIEDYCSRYDSDIRCYRKWNPRAHEYVHILFSSIETATRFLDARPHFIQNCRIK